MWQDRSLISLLFAIVLQLFCRLPGAARPGNDATSIIVSAGSSQLLDRVSAGQDKSPAAASKEDEVTGTLYERLGVSPDASAEEMKKASKKAYHRLASKWHPDKHAGEDDADKAKATRNFQKIGTAFEVLSHPDQRKTYNSSSEEEKRKIENGGPVEEEEPQEFSPQQTDSFKLRMESNPALKEFFEEMLYGKRGQSYDTLRGFSIHIKEQLADALAEKAQAGGRHLSLEQVSKLEKLKELTKLFDDLDGVEDTSTDDTARESDDWTQQQHESSGAGRGADSNELAATPNLGARLEAPRDGLPAAPEAGHVVSRPRLVTVPNAESAFAGTGLAATPNASLETRPAAPAGLAAPNGTLPDVQSDDGLPHGKFGVLAKGPLRSARSGPLLTDQGQRVREEQRQVALSRELPLLHSALQPPVGGVPRHILERSTHYNSENNKTALARRTSGIRYGPEPEPLDSPSDDSYGPEPKPLESSSGISYGPEPKPSDSPSGVSYGPDPKPAAWASDVSSGPLLLTDESQRVIEEQQSRLPPLRKALGAGAAEGLPRHGISALSPSSTNLYDPDNNNAALARGSFGTGTGSEPGTASTAVGSVLHSRVPASSAAGPDPAAGAATIPVHRLREAAPGSAAESRMGPEPPFNEINDEQLKEYENGIKANKQFPTKQQIKKEVKRAVKTGIAKAKDRKLSEKKKAARVIGRRLGSIGPMLDALETDMSKARMLAGDETKVIGIEANLEQLRKRGLSVLGDIKGAKKFSGTVMKHMEDGLKDARSHDNFKEKATRDTLDKMQEMGDSMEYPKNGSDNPEYHHEPYSHRRTVFEALNEDEV